MVLTKPMTVADLEAITDDEHQYELWNGELLRMSSVKVGPTALTNQITYLIHGHVIKNKLGLTTSPEGGYIIDSSGQTLFAPDFGFIRASRIPAIVVDDDWIRGVPDLAVEVMSSSDRLSRVFTKARMYLNAGSERVWIFDPIRRTVYDWPVGQAEPRLLSETDTLDGGELLPGFSIALTEVFSILDILPGQSPG